MSLISELIRKKREGNELSLSEIDIFVKGVSSLEVTDAQIAAFTMAVWFQNMAAHELRDFTLAMRDSGAVLDWQGLDGPVMDKHSTGGVGDLVSLVLGPMVAACGGYVPMISGRGLGHTGGTLDKLESIPGFNTSPSQSEFKRLVMKNGVSIIGQTDDLAPADRRIYAVRDVTATVASTPLIVSSILSKKLAEGLDALVMDIKVGNGAFMETLPHAQFLAQSICQTANDAGLACDAVLTDMSEPISWSAGNALEIREAVNYLLGNSRHSRLHEVVMAIASEMLVLGGLALSAGKARTLLEQVLESGAAAQRFSHMVADQGGPADLLDRLDKYLPVAPVVRPVIVEQSCWVESFDMLALGMIVVRLGGGRLRAEDSVDHSVGLSNLPRLGQHLEVGEPLLEIHARNETEWAQAATLARSAIVTSGRHFHAGGRSVILDRIKGTMEKGNGRQ